MTNAEQIQSAFVYAISALLTLSTILNLISLYRNRLEKVKLYALKEINWLLLVYNITAIIFQVIFTRKEIT